MRYCSIILFISHNKKLWHLVSANIFYIFVSLVNRIWLFLQLFLHCFTCTNSVFTIINATQQYACHVQLVYCIGQPHTHTLAVIMLRWPSPHMLTGLLLIVMAAVSMALSLPVKETWCPLLSTAPHSLVIATSTTACLAFCSTLRGILFIVSHWTGI